MEYLRLYSDVSSLSPEPEFHMDVFGRGAKLVDATTYRKEWALDPNETDPNKKYINLVTLETSHEPVEKTQVIVFFNTGFIKQSAERIATTNDFTVKTDNWIDEVPLWVGRCHWLAEQIYIVFLDEYPEKEISHKYFKYLMGTFFKKIGESIDGFFNKNLENVSNESFLIWRMMQKPREELTQNLHRPSLQSPEGIKQWTEYVEGKKDYAEIRTTFEEDSSRTQFSPQKNIDDYLKELMLADRVLQYGAALYTVKMCARLMENQHDVSLLTVGRYVSVPKDPTFYFWTTEKEFTTRIQRFVIDENSETEMLIVCPAVTDKNGQLAYNARAIPVDARLQNPKMK